MEEASSTKHEYVAGEVYALAGATQRHNRIAMNIAAQLWAAARDSGCRVYGSDMRLRIGNDAVYYPDVQVDMANFFPALGRKSGKSIKALTNRVLDGKNWQQWSRHRVEPDAWCPGIDNVESHLRFVTAFLEGELQK